MGDSRVFLYVASFVPAGASDGVWCFAWDSARGTTDCVGVARDGVDHPLYLTTDPSGRFLFVADCSKDSQHGRVVSYAIGETDGRLAPINGVSSHGAIPAFLTVSRTGRSLLTTNCGPFQPGSAGRTVAAFPIRPDGSIGAAFAVHEHHGSSIDPQRQTSPHPHSVVFDPAGRVALVADLGTDTVVVYAFDEQAQVLEPEPSGNVPIAAGSGPRHITFHPNGRFVYLSTEIANTVVAFSYDQSSGQLTELHTVTTLRDPHLADRAGADIQIHPSGRFLLCSNRIEQTIAIFTIDQHAGLLHAAGHTSTGGEFPRSLALDPTGAWLLAGNEYSGTVVAYHVDSQTGSLEPTGPVCEMPGPACVRFVTRCT